jgi:hypothetical protein
MQRPWHNQHHHIYSKDSSEDTRRRIETKIEVVFVEAHFGFRGGKETGMQMGC